jgi:hypothetical protein
MLRSSLQYCTSRASDLQVQVLVRTVLRSKVPVLQYEVLRSTVLVPGTGTAVSLYSTVPGTCTCTSIKEYGSSFKYYYSSTCTGSA